MLSILIRPATLTDASAIYDLLAAEGLLRDQAEITRHITDYTLMIHGTDLAAVTANQDGVALTAVHPGYPEILVSTSFAAILSAAAARENARPARLTASTRTARSFEANADTDLCKSDPTC